MTCKYELRCSRRGWLSRNEESEMLTELIQREELLGDKVKQLIDQDHVKNWVHVVTEDVSIH